MTNNKIQFVGTPCGQHGNYTFYKAVKYTLQGKQRILALGEFFFVKFFEEEDIISIGEPQLLWEDKPSGNILISLRLYFLPENTPDGRCEEHGEHEVISLGEKIILKVDDVINIMRPSDDIKWETGLEGIFGVASEDPLCLESPALYLPPISNFMDIAEINRERSLIGDSVDPTCQHVIVLGYNKYCRMRALLKRLEGVADELMKTTIVTALGGFLVPSHKTRLLYCREVFEYAELDGHELLCNHLAPKLQGRPRKKKRSRPDSESESSETSDDQRTWLKATKPAPITKSNSLISAMNQKPSSHALSKAHMAAMAEKLDEFRMPACSRLIEVDFISKLHKFMQDRHVDMNRMPVIDNKPINVFELFTRVQQYGGYDTVCQKKLWKSLYEEFSNKTMNYLSAGHNSFVGGSTLRKHYERILLPYEVHLLQEQKKLYNKKANNAKHQRNFTKHLKKAFELCKPKQESCEPSVSILQPPTPAIGASFEVADGGSTTITLIPSVSEPQLSDSVTNSISISPIDESCGQITIPKVPIRKEPAISSDIAKRPEITITAIPRDSSGISSASLTSFQLADLVSMNSSVGVSALNNLAKYAERCDKINLPMSKKSKAENSRLNGASGQRSSDDNRWASGSPQSKSALPVPDLVSTEFLRQMNMLDSNINSKFLLPAHQSNKTMNALASLLPHTSIYPAQVPAAHQQHSRASYKPQVETTKPEPVFQSQSVYSQSKNMYSKPDSPVKETNHDRNRNSSPEIEILDLRIPTDTKPNNHSRRDRLEIELLDLSNRKDITISAVCKPSSSRNSNSRPTSSNTSFRSVDGSRNQRSSCVSPKLSPVSNHTNPLAASMAASGLSPSALASLGMASPAMLQYLLAAGVNPEAHSPPGSSVPFMPYLDPASMAAYYSLLPHGLMQHGPNSAGVQNAANNAAMAAAAQQQASLAAHLAQLNSMNLTGLPNLSPETMANLGIYKNYLPHGALPAPHFLSGLMSPGSGSAHPPPK